MALIVSSDVKISSNEKLPHFIYKVPYEPGFSEELLVKPAIDGNQLKGMWALAQVEKVMCECLLNDTKLLQELKDFDLLVYEGAALCAVLLGEHLEGGYRPWITKCRFYSLSYDSDPCVVRSSTADWVHV